MSNTNSTPSVEQVAFDILADSAPAYRRVCRWCGAEAGTDTHSERICPGPDGFVTTHSYIEIPLTPEDFLPDDAHRTGCNCERCTEDREVF